MQLTQRAHFLYCYYFEELSVLFHNFFSPVLSSVIKGITPGQFRPDKKTIKLNLLKTQVV